jgi:outer membrane protein assembly factor BamB
MIWGPTDPGPDWDYYGLSTSIYDGKLFSYGYGGVLIAYDIQTGQELWTWSSGSVGLETFYENAPLNLGCIADGKIYFYSSEHSPSQPLRRDANIWCVDTDTGELLWKIQCWAGNLVIGDGYIVALDLFDNRIYCYGKGPSETTISVKDDSVAKGESIMITGTVTDQSAGAQGTPAIADANMENWMEYLYQQRPMPEDAQGVTVKLYAIDPNNNYQDIGEVTSDIWGNYGKSWTPPVEGDYLVIADFAGSAAYGSSSDSTYFTVNPAASPGQPIEPEEPVEAVALGITELAIIAVAIIAVIGVIAFWVLRKRQ